jgi:hypothetical protein
MADRLAGLAVWEDGPARALLGALTARPWLIAGPAIVALMLAAAWLRATPAEFRAAMVVGPVETLDRAADSRADASSDGGTGVSDFSRFLALLTSVEASRRLAREGWVLPAMFPEARDEATGRWHPPPGLGAWAERTVARLLGREAWRPPGPEALAERLHLRLEIGGVGASGLERIRLRHRDRDTALRLLALLHATADGMVREAAAARAEAQIAYVRERLAETDLVEHDRALQTLLLEQERRRMLIQADLPYAAALLEPPTAPPLPGWPNPFAVFCLAAACGVFTGLALAFAADGLGLAAAR